MFLFMNGHGTILGRSQHPENTLYIVPLQNMKLKA
jgi:hypothetical protein